MMERYTLNYSSPLYGRRTGQIKLRPLSFRYYPQFMPRSSVEQLMEFYAISGGVPKYMEFLDAQKSVLENIRDLFVNPAAYLYAEPRFLLAQEVRELTSYFSILKVIAAGNHKLGHIARQLGVETRHLTGYLKTLIDLDILERTVPVTEKNPEKSKKGLYRICDSVLRFWFRFIFPNQVYIESLQSEFVMKKIESDWAYFMGSVFEELITALVRKQLLLDFRVIKAGQWWNRDVQIDLAALTEDNQWILGECKWLSRPLDQGALIELETKAEYFSRHHREPIQHLALFSRSGFTERLQRAAGERGVLLYDLETIGGKLNGGATG
ncbi:MAG: ATP-binding protein [Calditrichaeota bacterium]|nr:MAG: ATP-binding protein [Calditrichota bacterium]